jgi:hypothetical protein
MAKKTTTKSKPEVAAKRAAKSVEKPKTTVTLPPKAIAAPVPVASKPPKTAVKAKRVLKVEKAAPKLPAFTQNDVALRAYFISEKRRAEGLPGDEHQDWLEAERQITAEFAKKKTRKKV